MGRVIPLTGSNKFTRDTGGVQGETRFVNLELVDYYRPCLVLAGQKKCHAASVDKTRQGVVARIKQAGFTRRPALT
jgi:ribosomal protein S3AE